MRKERGLDGYMDEFFVRPRLLYPTVIYENLFSVIAIQIAIFVCEFFRVSASVCVRVVRSDFLHWNRLRASCLTTRKLLVP